MRRPNEHRTDAELLRASRRDPTAFRALYDRRAGAIHAFAVRRTGSEDAGLDVTAETFARAWYHRNRFRDRKGGTALPWLYGIAANVLRESARTRQLADRATQRLGIELQVDRAGVTPEPAWIDGLDADLEAAIAALNDPQRAAVVGRVVRDQSYDDLAAELGCSPGAARVRVSRGLEHLRRSIAEETP